MEAQAIGKELAGDKAAPPETESRDMGPQILITGATGYIGGNLLRLLQAEGHRVRCVVRRPELLRDRIAEGTEVVKGDVLDRNSLQRAMEGIHTAYYLIHSMGTAQDFEETDRQAALCFGEAARAQGVRRIIYLGGLGDGSGRLSPHMRSRQEVGEILRNSGVRVIEFRASIIIGSGSLSFEMIRALVERLPVIPLRMFNFAGPFGFAGKWTEKPAGRP